MDPAGLEALWAFTAYAAQVALLVHGMVAVTAKGVAGNSFRKILALNLATLPLAGLLVIRRWSGVVRRHLWHQQVLALALLGTDVVGLLT